MNNIEGKPIPSEWSVAPLKYLGEVENSGIWGEDDPFPGSIEVKIPTTRTIRNDGTFEVDKMDVRHINQDDFRKYICKTGDIIIVKSSGSSENVISGKCALVLDKQDLSFGNFLMRFRPNKSLLEPNFIFYFLTSNVTRQRVLKMVSSTTYPNLKVDEYVTSKVPIPNLKEQRLISSYLNQKTSQVDKLLYNLQTKINLLKEQSTSLIKHYVTKGLDPNVEMKNSGVEWIGDIPKHWKIQKISTLYSESSIRGHKNEENLSVFRDFGVVRRKDHENHNVLSEDLSNYKLVHQGDLVLNKMKTWMGSLGVSDYHGIVSPAYYVLRPKFDFFSGYLHLLLRSKIYIDQYASASKGVRPAQWDLSLDDFKSLKIILPPIKEQKEIYKELSQQLDKNRRLSELVSQKILKLKEYRQALITSAVRGQLRITENMI